MKIPEWLKKIFEEGILELGAEGLTLPLLVALLKRVMGNHTALKETAEEKLKIQSAYLKVLGELTALPDCKDHPAKIATFVDHKLEPWQKEKFRLEVGRMAQIEVSKIGDVFKKKDTKKTTPHPKGGAPIIEETHEEEKEQIKSNLGLEFLKNFGKLSEDEMLSVCNLAGITHSDIKDLQNTARKIIDWAKKEGAEESDNLLKSIRKKTDELNAGLATKPQRSFLRTLLGLKAKDPKSKKPTT